MSLEDMKLKKIRYYLFKFIYLSILIHIAECSPLDAEDKLKMLKLECMDKTKVNGDEILKLRTGNWDTNDPVVQVWALCVLVKAGVMSENAVLRMDDAIRDVDVYDQADVSEKIDKCLLKRREQPHIIAWYYLKCVNMDDPTGFSVLP